jgi:predicted nucleic acid-binding protein
MMTPQIGFSTDQLLNQKLNNTGKFAHNLHSKNGGSVEIADESISKLTSTLSDNAKCTYDIMNNIMGDITEFTNSRWESLRRRFLNTCSTFDSDEIINIMMDDEESKRYIIQRMREILGEDWAAERETIIHQLTKHIGMLEMKNSMFVNHFETQNSNIAEKNKLRVLQDLFDGKQNQIVKMENTLELKNQEISMLIKNQNVKGSKSSRARKAIDGEYKQKYEKTILQNQQMQTVIDHLTSEVSQREHAIHRFENREQELRKSVQELESKVNNINDSHSNIINSESAIQMFNSRLQELEKERANHSEDETEALKTPNTGNNKDNEDYTKKLKNTLRVYKNRSKEFEKRR